MLDKYDSFIMRFCKNPTSTTTFHGEFQWQKKCRMALMEIVPPDGLINRKLACPNCGPKLKKSLSSFRKEVRRELKREASANSRLY